jgi:hypothetical protein
MDKKVEHLFTLIKNQLGKGTKVEKIIAQMKSDESLIEASNSYCNQCGNCCNKYCENKEVKSDGLTYCLLHDNSGKPYPHGKKKADYDSQICKERLNPKVWAKPEVCHTFGPHLGLFAILHYMEMGDTNMEFHHRSLCPGGDEMLADYEAFLKKD